jgi:hypothetical protein
LRSRQEHRLRRRSSRSSSASRRAGSKARQAHNVRFLRRLLSDPCIAITAQGRMRETAGGLRAAATRGPWYPRWLEDERAWLYGHTGIVTGRGIRFDIDRRRIAAWRNTDVFVRRGVRKAVSSQATLLRRARPAAPAPCWIGRAARQLRRSLAGQRRRSSRQRSRSRATH